MPSFLLALPFLLAAQAATPPAAPPPACTAPENRQFDFWIGNWDVYPTRGGNLVAHSLVERRYSGCAIRENWMPLGREGGGSFSAWRPEAGHWRQTWVDSAGSWVEFSGGMEGDAMVLTGLWRGVANGRDGLVRMHYTREAGGAVRQRGEVSTDNGRTWAPSFDLTYRPAAAR